MTAWGSAGCRPTSARSAAPSARSATTKQRPGHRVQIDVKFIAPIDGVTTRRHYQFTAIDDCSRLRVLRIYPNADQRTAIAFLDYVTGRLPFPIEVVQTDNGAESPDRLRFACARPRHRPRLHQTRHTQAQRHPQTITPHRRRRVLCRLLDGVTIDDTISQHFAEARRAAQRLYAQQAFRDIEQTTQTLSETLRPLLKSVLDDTR